jgi:hypothetical protein
MLYTKALKLEGFLLPGFFSLGSSWASKLAELYTGGSGPFGGPLFEG